MGASLMQSLLGIEMNIIPCKGMASRLNDLRAGHTDATIVSPATIAPLVVDGNTFGEFVVADLQRWKKLAQQPKITLVE